MNNTLFSKLFCDSSSHFMKYGKNLNIYGTHFLLGETTYGFFVYKQLQINKYDKNILVYNSNIILYKNNSDLYFTENIISDINNLDSNLNINNNNYDKFYYQSKLNMNMLYNKSWISKNTNIHTLSYLISEHLNYKNIKILDCSICYK